MFCPKCKYTTFDFYKKCPNCNYDWEHIRQELDIDWLSEPDIIEEDYPIVEANEQVSEEVKEERFNSESNGEVEFEEEIQNLDVEKTEKLEEEKELELDPSLFITDSDNKIEDRENNEEVTILDEETKEETTVELAEIPELVDDEKNIDADNEEESWDIEFDDLILEEDKTSDSEDKESPKKENFDLDGEIEILLEDNENSENRKSG